MSVRPPVYISAQRNKKYISFCTHTHPFLCPFASQCCNDIEKKMEQKVKRVISLIRTSHRPTAFPQLHVSFFMGRMDGIFGSSVYRSVCVNMYLWSEGCGVWALRLSLSLRFLAVVVVWHVKFYVKYVTPTTHANQRKRARTFIQFWQ